MTQKPVVICVAGRAELRRELRYSSFVAGPHGRQTRAWNRDDGFRLNFADHSATGDAESDLCRHLFIPVIIRVFTLRVLTGRALDTKFLTTLNIRTIYDNTDLYLTR